MKDRGVDYVKESGVIVSNDDAGSNEHPIEIKEVIARQLNTTQLISNSTFTTLKHYHDMEERC